MKYEKPMVINLGKAEDLIAGGSYTGSESINTTCIVNGKPVTHTYTQANKA